MSIPHEKGEIAEWKSTDGMRKHFIIAASIVGDSLCSFRRCIEFNSDGMHFFFANFDLNLPRFTGIGLEPKHPVQILGKPVITGMGKKTVVGVVDRPLDVSRVLGTPLNLAKTSGFATR